ncbi:MAG: TIGR03619 family F420-dependent LLM class oxidoreductase [Candidatus Saccharibacteria bacterium]|nr:TIGR03619 family F420-dependent LLM class oxidoreductase [Candidatus Saccharibacteria bacterium]
MSNELELGVIFPTKDIQADPVSVNQFAPRSEELGFDFIATYDHVIGVHQSEEQQQTAETDCTFTNETGIHEPMVMFGAMAALTKRIRFISTCLVSPQRQTALVAKQAAELDIISGGRLEMGLSVGWNEPEFEALGADFSQRAAKLEEQIPLLKKLWTQENVNHDGSEKMENANIKPLPIQKPIPIWVGGLSTKAIERAARLGDGWVPLGYPESEMLDKADDYWRVVHELGTDDTARVMGRVNPWQEGFQAAYKDLLHWQRANASHVAVGSSSEVHQSSDQYFSDLSRFKAYVDSKLSNKVIYLPTTGAMYKEPIQDNHETSKERPLKPLTFVITGTHSSGKSTLLDDLEDGKITDLGLFNPEYDDFGYGVVAADSGVKAPVITIPEAARWLADTYNRPDFLAENYTQQFQDTINAETIFRTHHAADLSEAVVDVMIEKGLLDPETDVIRPVILCDRSRLDGIVYGLARSEDADTVSAIETDYNRFTVPWIREYVDLAFVADHEEVEFENDGSRLADEQFRNRVANEIDEVYRDALGKKFAGRISGDRIHRKRDLIQAIVEQAGIVDAA